MKKNISILSMVLLSTVLSINSGCDFGTYQSRASEPVPMNASRAGDLNSPANSESQDPNG